MVNYIYSNSLHFVGESVEFNYPYLGKNQPVSLVKIVEHVNLANDQVNQKVRQSKGFIICYSVEDKKSFQMVSNYSLYIEQVMGTNFDPNSITIVGE